MSEPIDKTWLAKTISEGLLEVKVTVVNRQIINDLFDGDEKSVERFCAQQQFACRQNPVTGKFEFRKRL